VNPKKRLCIAVSSARQAVPAKVRLDPSGALFLLRRLHDEQKEQAYCDMLSAAFERRDRRVVDRVVDSLNDPKHAIPTIQWAAQDPGFIATDWGFQAIARSAVVSVSRSANTEDTFDVAKELFARAVDHRRWEVGPWFIDYLVDKASSPDVLGRVHLCELFIEAGQALWLTQDYAIRPVAGGSRLEDLQTSYLIRITHFAHDLVKTKDARAMEMLIGGASRIMFDTGEGPTCHD
jgi:hypothetical protein